MEQPKNPRQGIVLAINHEKPSMGRALNTTSESASTKLARENKNKNYASILEMNFKSFLQAGIALNLHYICKAPHY